MRRHVHPRRRFAEGTARRDTPLIQNKRMELHDAFATREPDAIIVSTLALVQLLIDEHRLAAAAYEIDGVIAALEDTAPPQLWRLHLTIAVVYDGLGEPDRARTSARAGQAAAREAHDRTGVARANAVLRRLGCSSTKSA